MIVLAWVAVAIFTIIVLLFLFVAVREVLMMSWDDEDMGCFIFVLLVLLFWAFCWGANFLTEYYK